MITIMTNQEQLQTACLMIKQSSMLRLGAGAAASTGAASKAMGWLQNLLSKGKEMGSSAFGSAKTGVTNARNTLWDKIFSVLQGQAANPHGIYSSSLRVRNPTIKGKGGYDFGSTSNPLNSGGFRNPRMVGTMNQDAKMLANGTLGGAAGLGSLGLFQGMKGLMGSNKNDQPPTA